MAKRPLTVDIADLRVLLQEEIRLTVNGKVDKVADHVRSLEKRFDKHEAQLLPLLQGLKFIQWIGVGATSALAFYASLKIGFPNLKLW